MLTIRPEQLAALRAAHAPAMRAVLRRHASRCHPEEVEALGPGGLAEAIEFTIVRGCEYGLGRDADLCRFLTLTLLFGMRWETSPEHAWMDVAMRQPQPADAEARLAAVYERVLEREEGG